MTMTGIYLIKNMLSGKFYIGSAVSMEKRFYEHRWALERNRHNNIHLQRAWSKDGKDNIIFEKYLECSKEDLILYEQLILDSSIFSFGRENIYNISPTAGSTLGRLHSKETKIKIGIKSKGRWSGKHHTEETKEKIRLGNIGKNKGKKASIETRKKMSEYRKGRKFSEEHKRNLSISLRGHKVSVETRKKLSMFNTGKRPI
jgi:group I intron endonuclease